MWTERVFLIFVLFLREFSRSQDIHGEITTVRPRFVDGEKKLSAQILEMLDHFQQPDPVGLPGANIPDPFPVPDLTKTINFDTIFFKNTSVHGVSKFRILYVNADMENMMVDATMVIDKLQTRGNYTYCSSFMCFNKIEGPFTIDVTGLKVTGRATLGVELNGKLRAHDIDMDMSFDSLSLNFRNLGIWGTLIQGVINSLSNFIFDSIKPSILKDSRLSIRAAINKKLDELVGDEQFPNTLSPLDMVIVDTRNAMQENGMDPYKLKDQNSADGMVGVKLSQTWITGISTIHRIGNITVKMEKGSVLADFEIGTQTLEGLTNWDISVLGGIISVPGTASFAIEHLNGRLVISQPLDTRKKPELQTLKLDVGNIQVRCDGAGTLDYVIEFVINVLPNVLRYQIIDSLENTMKEKLQEELYRIDVNEVIVRELPRIDELQHTDFKLSSLRAAGNKRYDEDEFFNF